MQPTETFTVDKETVSCDGGGGQLGHPRVFLSLHGGRVSCPYCGRAFVLRAGAKVGHGH
ncbi:MAG: zinc-finger domain-containing protein [Rhodospirillaceae bacterium]